MSVVPNCPDALSKIDKLRGHELSVPDCSDILHNVRIYRQHSFRWHPWNYDEIKNSVVSGTCCTLIQPHFQFTIPKQHCGIWVTYCFIIVAGGRGAKSNFWGVTILKNKNVDLNSYFGKNKETTDDMELHVLCPIDVLLISLWFPFDVTLRSCWCPVDT